MVVSGVATPPLLPPTPAAAAAVAVGDGAAVAAAIAVVVAATSAGADDAVVAVAIAAAVSVAVAVAGVGADSTSSRDCVTNGAGQHAARAAVQAMAKECASGCRLHKLLASFCRLNIRLYRALRSGLLGAVLKARRASSW